MRIVLIFLFLLYRSIFADIQTYDPTEVWRYQEQCIPPLIDEELAPTLNLISPIYEAGVLKSEIGGTFQSKGLFVQARNLIYTHKLPSEHNLFCQGDILVDYHGQLFIAKSLNFDFLTQSGKIECAQTCYFPWQIRAESVLLLPNGCFVIEKGVLTTSEGPECHVAFKTESLMLTPERLLKSSPIKLTFCDRTLFVLPSFSFSLNHLRSPPIQAGVGWGGYMGPYLTLRYRFFERPTFHADLRLDGYMHHGLGLGLETTYCSAAKRGRFMTRNYWAHDLAIDDPKKRGRYRFQATYFNALSPDTRVDAIYDFVSDAQMAADYQHRSFALNPAEKSELLFHHRSPNYLANFLLDVRVNSFQTVNQKLPIFELNFKPFQIPCTNIIFDNRLQIGYLNFVTSHHQKNPLTFQSARLETNPRLYMPLRAGPITFTPDLQFIGIGYSNTPQGGATNQMLFDGSLSAKCTLWRNYGSVKHLLQPYARYTHLTTPSSSLKKHFIFSLHDAYQRMDLLRFGLYNQFCLSQNAFRPLTVDLWANAFLNATSGVSPIPKGYLESSWLASPTLLLRYHMGYSFTHHTLAFCKSGAQFTLSENSALNLEAIYHSRYDWRKADFYNFILEAVRKESDLLDSNLSQRRKVILLSLFHRLSPDWEFKISLRAGRTQKRNYLEYELSTRALLAPHWRLYFGYQKREVDHRFLFSLKLDR